MNRLQLCNSLMVECAIPGPMQTTIGQTGELARVVGWIDQAWNDVQTEHDDWNWMRSSVLLGGGASFTTIAGQAYYPLGTGAGTSGIPLANFAKWAKKTFRNYTTSVGFINEIFMDDIPYDAWRDAYMYGAQRTVQTRPVAVAIGPGEEVCVGPPPNGLYTITGDYFRAPTVMAADADTPTGLPAAQHMIIVYRAMWKYAGYEAASEVYQTGKENWGIMLAQLEAIKMPEVRMGGALA